MNTSKRASTVSDLLVQGALRLKRAGVEEWRVDCEVLLAWCLGWERWRLLSRSEEVVEGECRRRFLAALERRCAGEPVSRIVGSREFWSLDFEVDGSVLVPRPETELLVEQALEVGGRLEPSALILDLGTGSGAVAVALARELPSVQIVATDISLAALAVARRNARRLGVADRIAFVAGSWLSPFATAAGFRLIVSNPPYIPSGEIDRLDREVREWDPRHALDGGGDGLDPLRHIAGELPRIAGPDAWFMCEIGEGQGDSALAVISGVEGVLEADVVKDLAGRDRVLKVRLAGLRSL